MSQTNFDYLINKYGEIIKEEVNIKNISKLPDDIQIKVVFKPIGKNISEKFGKDTGNIISLSKAGNVQELGNGQIKVFGNGGEWILEKDDYEIAYEGIDETNMAVESGTIVKLNMEITPILKREGIIREISRFLNQMRKDAGYNVDDRVNAYFNSDNPQVEETINEFKDFLKAEALLSDIISVQGAQGDLTAVFESELGNIDFILKR